MSTLSSWSFLLANRTSRTWLLERRALRGSQEGWAAGGGAHPCWVAAALELSSCGPVAPPSAVDLILASWRRGQSSGPGCEALPLGVSSPAHPHLPGDPSVVTPTSSLLSVKPRDSFPRWAAVGLLRAEEEEGAGSPRGQGSRSPSVYLESRTFDQHQFPAQEHGVCVGEGDSSPSVLLVAELEPAPAPRTGGQPNPAPALPCHGS